MSLPSLSRLARLRSKHKLVSGMTKMPGGRRAVRAAVPELRVEVAAPNQTTST
jgi:hypothetical protein